MLPGLKDLALGHHSDVCPQRQDAALQTLLLGVEGLKAGLSVISQVNICSLPLNPFTSLGFFSSSESNKHSLREVWLPALITQSPHCITVGTQDPVVLRIT